MLTDDPSLSEHFERQVDFLGKYQKVIENVQMRNESIIDHVGELDSLASSSEIKFIERHSIMKA